METSAKCATCKRITNHTLLLNTMQANVEMTCDVCHTKRTTKEYYIAMLDKAIKMASDAIAKKRGE